MDTVDQSIPTSTENTEQTQEQQVQDLMRFAFQEQMPQEKALESTTETQPAAEPTTTPPATTEPAKDQIIDEDVFVKERFGYDSESLKALLTEYNELKTKATTPAEFQFASDEAKKLAHAINSKDYKTVKTYVEAQELSLEGMSDEQKLKTYIRMQNPLFDQELVDYTFNKAYTFNEEEFADDPMSLKFERISRQQKMQNDLKAASDFFSQYKQQAQLPDIQQANPSVDEAYEQYKASTAKHAEIFNNEIVPAINALKESDLQMSFKVEDVNNQMNFDLSVAIDQSDFEKAKNAALDFGSYMEKTFYDEKGNFQPKKFMQAILKGEHFDKYAQTISRQAVNAERKRVIDANTTVPPAQRNFTIPEEEQDPIKEQWKRAMAV